MTMVIIMAIIGYFFSHILLAKFIELGIFLGDKLVKISNILAYHCIGYIKTVIKKYIDNKLNRYSVKPIIDITPLELQQLKRHQLQYDKRLVKKQTFIINQLN